MAKVTEDTSNYKGLTKKKYKRLTARTGSTPGSSKGENCRCTGLRKGVIKYPRFYRTDPILYTAINAETDKAAKGRKTVTGGTLNL